MIRMCGFRWMIVFAMCMVSPGLCWSQQERLTEKTEFYNDGKVMSRSKYNPEGTLVERTYYYDDGTIEKTQKYNSAGQETEEANYGNDGELSDGLNGWAAKRWQYKDGQLRAESSYGEDGRLTERKIYNALGDLVDRQYVGDGNIDPDEEFNRGSVVRRETDQFFDNYGNQTGSATTEVDDFDGMY